MADATPAPPDEPFSVGDSVRLHIPDSTDFDHETHGMTGEVKAIHEDDLTRLPGTVHELDDYKYIVDLDDTERTFPARHSDLRPAAE